MEEAAPPFSDYKLCGYLLTVVEFPPLFPQSIPLPSLLRLSPSNPSFIAPHNHHVLYPIDQFNHTIIGNSSRKWRKIGMVEGSLSVVRQLHFLVNRNCIRIVARLVRIEKRNREDDEEARGVVLVDVYVPLAVWSNGWQFPRAASTAAALFRHLCCDWEARRSLLNVEVHDDISVWDVSDCHVLGCNQHCSVPNASKKKLFELHEIFRNLPGLGKKGKSHILTVCPADDSKPFLWIQTDDVLLRILTLLPPIDLFKVSATCRALRLLCSSIMPCMKLKLYDHQMAAVEWMLHRERDPETLPHPLYIELSTEDGFFFYVNTVSGNIITGKPPTIKDFRGGFFCDEPGLGKTITALSLILKTQGTLAEAPDRAQMVWCTQNADQRCGYYEISSDNEIYGGLLLRNSRSTGPMTRRGKVSVNEVSTQIRTRNLSEKTAEPSDFIGSPGTVRSTLDRSTIRNTGSSSNVQRNLLYEYEESPSIGRKIDSRKRKSQDGQKGSSSSTTCLVSSGSVFSGKRQKIFIKETWVQCNACQKWRKLAEGVDNAAAAWFCSMNSDTMRKSCNVPEESYDHKDPITYFPGFHSKETPGGKDENILFFIDVLREKNSLINSRTKKALTWLSKLSPNKLLQMENIGVPVDQRLLLNPRRVPEFHIIFESFGLVKRADKGTIRWYYPRGLADLAFDLDALRVALSEPLDTFRMYLSRATLVVVPSYLVDHWRAQIQRHVRPGQLKVYVWTDNKKPPAHVLGWDYDVVITTFSRLSAEWSPRKKSALMQVHWLRIILDEGHTLGSSVSLTNKLQMVMSLTATNRWLLTGTPTPNTPNSQLSHLQPLLKFLKEEAYGQNQKCWETSIMRPFEAEMEDGRLRLLQLLCRCMISARKVDLQTIPACFKKVTLLNFTEEHARTYNELVETIRRNILLADWNDPSHVESLLNHKRWKFRSATMTNVRLSCCVAGHIRVTEAGNDIQETMDELVQKGLEPGSEEYVFLRDKLHLGTSCMRCKAWCRLPVITPCRHLLCIGCVALDSEKCTFPECGNLYKMQSPETLARPENPNPKWPVPQDLIELQPSYKQDDWNPDWQSTSSSKVSYLVSKLKNLHQTNMKSHEEQAPDKVIIFSQFLEHIHVIEEQLKVADIQFVGMYSPMHSIHKMKALETFQHDRHCMALVMDGSAALGLDLSFVTHVYLMEPIWDKSMEEQVISRAHRMGATQPIHVETLAMSGTIEEQMLRMLRNAKS
ncbi:hypothetical protein Leryth_001471 [Lithospermum erythrorhizon]|nr:hypothetical protein Leryth_001471 [Lithospermum erythrorhizon]